ncbi:hypothetical protein THASP1DRAFT_17748 [Thamnocephalis sphaerospora]|uniref:Complex 1 LYR protein domain-containing protein n=1 Tax=Thamnocephalis sphaerospora TaxID=78915 RepID=A0A4P9XM98_9FUNG|nr:hypothetical protein THASP1DRAFT_17748 [Thamnocephalis sphaerospora]|eukprot:RKP06972.1 hypothetical protein THASP1DRAFT_17748 [Thamnocephalis sphaerospora]
MSSVAAAARKSGLQLEVLHFYRACMRAVRTKPEAAQPRFRQFVRQQFRRHDLRPADVAAIEHLLRIGKRQLESYGHPSVRNISA